MTFSRIVCAQRAHALSQQELDLAIHVVCSAFSSQQFPGVESLDNVRDVIDILAYEQHRRRASGAGVQAGG